MQARIRSANFQDLHGLRIYIYMHMYI